MTSGISLFVTSFSGTLMNIFLFLCLTQLYFFISLKLVQLCNVSKISGYFRSQLFAAVFFLSDITICTKKMELGSKCFIDLNKLNIVKKLKLD